MRVYEALLEWTESTGFPPTLREIADLLGFRSPNSVRYHLRRLDEMGLIQRNPYSARGAVPNPVHLRKKDRSRTAAAMRADRSGIPILGRVAAGLPVDSEENREGFFPLDSSWLGSEPHFALRVQGESMTGAGISDGDLVLVRRQENVDPGEIVVALLDGEATVKRLVRRRGKLLLHPENDAFEDIAVEGAADLKILGKVVGLYRSLTAPIPGARGRG